MAYKKMASYIGDCVVVVEGLLEGGSFTHRFAAQTYVLDVLPTLTPVEAVAVAAVASYIGDCVVVVEGLLEEGSFTHRFAAQT